MTIPEGTTHTSEFYGTITYYRRSTYPHLNHVSEEWETMTRYDYWENGRWVDVGAGFSARRLQPVNRVNIPEAEQT